MRPFRDPARDRADGRRLAAALGVSAAVHVAVATLWLAAGPRDAPTLAALDEYPPTFVLTDVVEVPDPPAGEAGGTTGGGDVGEAAPPAVERSPPPTAVDPRAAAPVVRQAPPLAAAISRTAVPRPAPDARTPSGPAVPTAPGPPSSGPPAPSGSGTASASPGTGGPGGGGGTGGDGAGNAAGDGMGGGGDGGAGRLVERPERSPRTSGFAFPVYPAEARQAGVSGRARVRILVGADRRGSRHEIIERVVIDRRGREQAVPVLPFGMEAAILDAARSYTFVPARDGGENVRAYTVIEVKVGTDR